MYDVLRNINISNIIFHTDFKIFLILTIYSFICMYVCLYVFLCHCAYLSVREYFTGISLSFHNVGNKIKCLYLLDHFALFVFMLTYKSNKIIGALKKPVTRRGKNKREGKLTEYSEITANMYLGSQSTAQTRVHKLGQLRASTG